MANLLSRAFPDSRVSHDLYHNHVLREIISQIRKIAFVKALVLLCNWIIYCKFSYPFNKREITIFGADTIWMYNHPIAPNDMYFFGEDITEGRLLSVCPSNAGSPYPSNEKIKKLLAKFEFVGVRDLSTKKFLQETIQANVDIVCDPAFFILQPSNPNKKIDRSANQISVYANSCNEVQKRLKILCKENYFFKDKDVIYLGYFPNLWTNFTKQFLGIYGVLANISKSKLLITDTFHGVIMALMTKTPFILIKSDIVMARLNGPILNCFSKERIFSINEFSNLCKFEQFCDRSDFHDEKLNEFIAFSENIIIERIKELTTSNQR